MNMSVRSTANRRLSDAAFAEAKEHIPGGVDSPVRSFRGVGGTPPFIARARGSRIYDIDGNEYVDYILSYGPLLLGHAHPRVVEAIREAASRGTSYGAPTLGETELARRVKEFMPAAELVRFVSSGTEATMSALRLARAHTGRDCIVKFIGCYHGHHDSLLVKAGSGAATLGTPDSPGVPASMASTTLTLQYNDADGLEALFRERGSEIAAVIIEPTPGNMGLVLPRNGYLEAVRRVTREHGALLICDEVMSGFRASRGGSQALWEIDPDIICLGKVIGGGLPVGAYCGRRRIMSGVAPAGPMYQAGTLSGNPLAVAAGLATLETADEIGAFAAAEHRTEQLCAELERAAAAAGARVRVQRLGSMFTVFFRDGAVESWADAEQCDTKAFAAYFHAMLDRGVCLPPSQFETCFLSSAHTDADIERTAEAAREAFAEAAKVQRG